MVLMLPSARTQATPLCTCSMATVLEVQLIVEKASVAQHAA